MGCYVMGKWSLGSVVDLGCYGNSAGVSVIDLAKSDSWQLGGDTFRDIVCNFGTSCLVSVIPVH